MIEIHSINKNEALRYLGYLDEEPTYDTLIALEKNEKELLKVIKPRYIYKCFDLIKMEDKVALKDCDLILSGESIAKHLYYCDKAVLMCVTISADVDKLIKKAQVEDLVDAVMLDSLASAAVEQVCDEVEEEIKKEYSNYSTTNRFSPGYGDLPLSIERDWLAVMDAQRKIGLFITHGDMLTPRKSVTAVIGLSDSKIENRALCDECEIKEKCEKRKRGEYCGL